MTAIHESADSGVATAGPTGPAETFVSKTWAETWYPWALATGLWPDRYESVEKSLLGAEKKRSTFEPSAAAVASGTMTSNGLLD